MASSFGYNWDYADGALPPGMTLADAQANQQHGGAASDSGNDTSNGGDAMATPGGGGGGAPLPLGSTPMSQYINMPTATAGNLASGSSGSYLTNLLNSMISPNGLTALGKGLGGVASSDASNRGAKLAAMLASDQMQLAEQNQRNQDLASMPKQLRTADYLAGGGYTPKTNYSSTGRAIPHFDLGMKPIDANLQAAGSTLEKQLTDRLNNAPTYQNYASVMNPSATEIGLNIASPILTAVGAASQPPDPTAALIQKVLANQKTGQ